ncbi:hypothetical protein FHR85_001995 [Alkalibacillus almallahensis]|nr:hypothetical protein [Alkalibacillus almallahensis]
MNKENNKNADIFGWVITVLLVFAVFVLFISVPIALTFGVIFTLSIFPIVEFKFFSDFWSNSWYFLGFTTLNVVVLIVSEVLMTLDRKKGVDKKSEFGPKTIIEWAVHILIFTVYINVFDIYSERLNASIVGSMVVSISIILLFSVIEWVLSKFQN